MLGVRGFREYSLQIKKRRGADVITTAAPLYGFRRMINNRSMILSYSSTSVTSCCPHVSAFTNRPP